jgi:hypothetical protein
MEVKKVMVLGARRYSFTSPQNGKLVEGTKVHYYELDPDFNDDQVGYTPNFENITYADYMGFKHMKFPVMCEAELSFSLSGKKQVKIKSFKQLQDTK